MKNKALLNLALISSMLPFMNDYREDSSSRHITQEPTKPREYPKRKELTSDERLKKKLHKQKIKAKRQRNKHKGRR